MSDRPLPPGPLGSALNKARAARLGGRLRAALEALDHAVSICPPDDQEGATALAEEGAHLGAFLELKDSLVAGLSEFQRALDLDSDLKTARDGVSRAVRSFDRWKPPLGAIAAGEQLIAGATGAFWVSRSQKGRVVVFQGGINGETVGAAKKALDVAGQGVSWLLVDMKKLAYVGSTGLATAVKVAENLESGGGGLVLYSVASNLAIVINTLGLGKYLKVVADLDAALAQARGVNLSAPAD